MSTQILTLMVFIVFHCVHIFGSKSKNTKKGRHSGGITFYYRKQFKNYIHIVDKLKQGIIWVKISKEMLTLDEDVFICHCYIPPSDSKIMLNSDFDFHEKLEADIMKYENLGKVYVTGDMNCRTSNEHDFLSFDKYLDQNLPFVDKQNIPLRQNYDKVIDSNGRKLIDICLATGLLIANGRLENDEKGTLALECYFCNGTSVFDCPLSKVVTCNGSCVYAFAEAFDNASMTMFYRACFTEVLEANGCSDKETDPFVDPEIIRWRYRRCFCQQNLCNGQSLSRTYPVSKENITCYTCEDECRSQNTVSCRGSCVIQQDIHGNISKSCGRSSIVYERFNGCYTSILGTEIYICNEDLCNSHAKPPCKFTSGVSTLEEMSVSTFLITAFAMLSM